VATVVSRRNAGESLTVIRLAPDAIIKVLTTFIDATIMARSHPVQPDDDLELAGLDSMALLKILLFIEAEYGFWMPDEDLVEENIRTVRALATYISRQRSES
jgi:acyl carrier protein